MGMDESRGQTCWTSVRSHVRGLLPDWPMRIRQMGRLPRYARLRVHASKKTRTVYALVINRALSVLAQLDLHQGHSPLTLTPLPLPPTLPYPPPHNGPCSERALPLRRYL